MRRDRVRSAIGVTQTWNAACSYVRSLAHGGAFFAYVAPLRACNVECGYCYQLDMQPGVMSPGGFGVCLDGLKQLGVGIVSFTGGEPLLWPHLEYAVKECRRARLATHLNTNGRLLTDERLGLLADAGLMGMLVSVDSMKSAEDFPKSLAANDRLLATMETARRDFGIVATCNIVLTPKNSDDAIEVVEAMHDARIPVSIGFGDSEPGSSGGKYAFELPRDRELLRHVVAKIIDLKRMGRQIIEPARYFADYEQHLEGKTVWRCRKPNMRSFTIDPSGAVLLCSRLPLVIGSIREPGSISSEDSKATALRQVQECSARCYSNCSYNSAYYQDHVGATLMQAARLAF